MSACQKEALRELAWLYDKIGVPEMVRAGCMAHARRKFHDALKIDPEDREAAAVIAIMAKLYAVEKEAREGGLAPEQRQELRQRKSKPIVSDPPRTS